MLLQTKYGPPRKLMALPSIRAFFSSINRHEVDLVKKSQLKTKAWNVEHPRVKQLRKPSDDRKRIVGGVGVINVSTASAHNRKEL